MVVEDLVIISACFRFLLFTEWIVLIMTCLPFQMSSKRGIRSEGKGINVIRESEFLRSCCQPTICTLAVLE